jgi:hypothetical protein
MKKQKTNRANPRPRAVTQPRTTATGCDPLESALGMAARIAEPYAEEAEAIENLIRFVRGHRDGQPGDGRPGDGPPGDRPPGDRPPGGVRRTDVLLALSILITALDREPTPEERMMFAFLDALLGVPPRGVPAVPASVPPYVASVAPQRPRPRVSRYAPTSSPPVPNIPLTA